MKDTKEEEDLYVFVVCVNYSVLSLQTFHIIEFVIFICNCTSLARNSNIMPA